MPATRASLWSIAQTIVHQLARRLGFGQSMNVYSNG